MMDGDRAIAQKLVDWFYANQRDLPFRHTKDPYHIWVSEIMAQQTRITALLPYYRTFMEMFPNIAALAAADEAQLLKAWEGLGYYARARHLQAAAKQLVICHGGQLPEDRQALLALPGIGAYTAGAILSIAFARPEPAVDGNVMRVMARIDANDGDIAKPALKDWMAQRLRPMIPANDPGAFTQALMELGALICLPREPRCALCPVQTLCRAKAEGREKQLPVKEKKKPQREEKRAVALLRDTKGRYLLRQRGERLLHGLWEFPGFAGEGTEALKGLDLLGLEGIQWDWALSASHTFTHIRWQMEAYFGQWPHEGEAPEGHCWADMAAMEQLAIPSAFAKPLAWVRKREEREDG